MHVCMCVCMHLCMYVCMYVWMDGWMGGWMDGWMDVWIGGCVHVCRYLCMYVCTYVCMQSYVMLCDVILYVAMLFYLLMLFMYVRTYVCMHGWMDVWPLERTFWVVVASVIEPRQARLSVALQRQGHSASLTCAQSVLCIIWHHSCCWFPWHVDPLSWVSLFRSPCLCHFYVDHPWDMFLCSYVCLPSFERALTRATNTRDALSSLRMNGCMGWDDGWKIGLCRRR